MKKIPRIVLAFAVVLITSIIGLVLVYMFDTRSQHAPDVAHSSRWVSVFSDNFSGNALDLRKWTTCYDWRPVGALGCTNTGNNEQEWYMPQQVSVHDGSASLTAERHSITTNGKMYPYQSGMISTGRNNADSPVKWSGTYGYYVARMKFDGGQGVWPAFWLLPADRSWPPEIDVMEFLGQNPNQVLLTNHWRDTSGQPQENGSVIQGPDFTQGWHTYAINWQPRRIDWYVDGALRKTVTGSEVPSKPMEIIVDLAIGGRLPGNADATTQFPRTAQIDYVYVYEMKQ